LNALNAGQLLRPIADKIDQIAEVEKDAMGLHGVGVLLVPLLVLLGWSNDNPAKASVERVRAGCPPLANEQQYRPSSPRQAMPRHACLSAAVRPPRSDRSFAIIFAMQ
jgi:hypothetical protein